MADARPNWCAGRTENRERRIRETVYMIVAGAALLLTSAALGVACSIPGLLIQAVREALVQ